MQQQQQQPGLRPHTSMTGADAIISAAAAGGVSICFANPGTTEMHFLSALDKAAGGMRPVLCLHETVATGAADGYARMARRPAMVLLHLGPGLANGLANMHNARRAGSKVLVVVGDMAQWHRHTDPLLNMEIEALAGSVSGLVVNVSAKQPVAAAMHSTLCFLDCPTPMPAQMPAPALPSHYPHPVGSPLAHAGGVAACPGSRVATLIVPHDITWEPFEQPFGDPHSEGNVVQPLQQQQQRVDVGDGVPEGVMQQQLVAFVKDCAAALRAVQAGKTGPGPKAALYIGGEALLEDGGALRNAGLIAAAVGADLLCENAFARLDRGAGLPCPTRLPYFPQEAVRCLQQYSCLVVVGTRLPVANFGYKDGPSQLVTLAQDQVWLFDQDLGSTPPPLSQLRSDGQVALPGGGSGSVGSSKRLSAATALALLAEELGAAAQVTPLVNCGGLFCPPRRPPMPRGRLTPDAMCAIVACLQPPGCVVVDESLTSGMPYWQHAKGCPPFSHLALTGGAIGSGMPLALGAAMACPGRRVICMEGDGSAMYCLPALWSQAREGLPVTTIICDNSCYAILNIEAARQRLPPLGPAARQLTDLGRPRPQWQALAQGMGVPSAAADSAEAFAAALQHALTRPGPFLIQALLA